MAKWAKEHGLLLAKLALFLVFFGEMMVGASVYPREKGSPESKPVAEPHYETGS